MYTPLIHEQLLDLNLGSNKGQQDVIVTMYNAFQLIIPLHWEHQMIISILSTINSYITFRTATTLLGKFKKDDVPPLKF